MERNGRVVVSVPAAGNGGSRHMPDRRKLACRRRASLFRRPAWCTFVQMDDDSD